MRKVWLIALVSLLIAVLLLAAPAPARADDTIVFDFRISNYSFVADVSSFTGQPWGVWTSGIGWQASCTTFAEDHAYNMIQMSRSFGTLATITEMDVKYHLTTGIIDNPTLKQIIGVDNYSTILEDEAQPFTTGSNIHLTYTGSASASANFGFSFKAAHGDPLVNVTHNCAGIGGSLVIEQITITGTLPFATFTPSPSPTPTPTATPGALPSIPTAPRCDLIRQDIATFENLFAWQILPESAGAGHPSGQPKGLTMPSGVTADLELNLDTAAQYVIRLEFHRTTASTGGTFELRLGTEPAFKVDIDPGDSGTQVFEVPAGNYTPNPGNYNMEGSALYKLILTAPTWSPNPGLIIDFVCISVNTEGGGPGSGGGTGDAGGGGLFGGGIQQTACEECTYNPVGDLFQDIPRLIEWLWCGLSQLFDCVLRNVLYGLWQTIVRIIQIIAFLRLWAGLILERAIAWVLGNLGVLAAWLGGHIINLLTAIGAPILNVASGFINGVLSLLAGLWGFFQQVLVVLSAIATFLTSAVGLVGNGFQFVVSIVEQIWHFISQVVGIVPILIGSLIAGLNASAASIPSWAPACNNPSSLLYYPCLGMYVLDNTIFLGPVYYLVPIAIALVAWQVIGWAIKQFREALTAR
jgi:hypothetical protein